MAGVPSFLNFLSCCCHDTPKSHFFFCPRQLFKMAFGKIFTIPVSIPALSNLGQRFEQLR